MSVFVKVPSPVDIYERVFNPETKATERRHTRTMAFVEIIDWLTNDQYFAAPAKMGRVAAELLAEFENAPPGSFVKLTSEQHGHIKKVLESPTAALNPLVSKQIASFIDALAEPMTEEQYKKTQAPQAVEAAS